MCLDPKYINMTISYISAPNKRTAVSQIFNPVNYETVATDPYIKYTTLLLQGEGTNGAQNNTFLDSSTNAFSITRNGNATQGTFTPYGSNWSNYFNGSDAYWKQSSSTNYTFGTSDFTIELWININSTSTQMRRIIGVGYGANGGSHGCTWDIRYLGTESPTGQIMFGRYDGGTETNFTTSGATITVGTWTHIAISRTGGNLRIFVDGVAYYSAANSTNYTAITYGSNTEFWAGLGYYGPPAGLTGPRYFGGYFSNIRIINGTGIYSSTFTPSTTPLTAVTNTQLIAAQSNRFLDTSTNAQAITPSGSPSVQRFSPFSPTTAYSTSVIGGSAYFDGTGDYLTAPSNVNLSSTLLASNFTIECWIYVISLPNAPTIWTNSVSNSDGFSGSYVQTNGTIGTGKYGVNEFNTTNTIKLNTWTHFALVRNSGTLYVYLNGVQDPTTGAASTYLNTSATKPMQIGSSNQNTPAALHGYISDLRVVSSALYTASFTVNTTPLTAVSGTNLLLSATNAGILDNAEMNNLETVGNAQISTSVKKYGSGSMYFDGVSPYSYLKGNANLSQGVAFGTGDFTVECWVYLTTTASDSVIIDTRPGANTANYFLFYLWTNGGAQQPTIAWYSPTNYKLSTGGSVSANTWTHIAVTRSSGNIRSFKDGILQQTAADTITYANPGAPYPYIGAAYGVGVDSFKGYVDGLRITKGNARYTANFTPSITAFENL